MRWLLSLTLALVPLTAFAAPPNVLLVITDDQGWGDLGTHGNPVIQTPKLDAFAKESAWLKNFYVCPVCAPTRASLLSGQYNYRTGVVDTFIGRAMMRPDVTTLPEMLAKAGYRTGLFGKWHLGDNYPMRPEDRGFQETLWSAGGGLAQPSDPPRTDPKTAYFDPVLKQNGKEVKTKGYCTDVFTDAALKFIAAESDKPFFAYVAYNAPHAPYQVPTEYAAKYAKLDLTAKAFPDKGRPWATGKKLNIIDIASAYGMIDNIDTNFGRLIKALEEKKLAENTIVIFLTDNGPGGVRWNGGLRNRKGTVYEGGIRVPCYVRWPAKVKAQAIDIPLAHIDVTPTLLAACGVAGNAELDGRNFLPLLAGEKTRWADRTLFFQWHRGDEPEKYRAFAALARYKLVQASGVPQGAKWTPMYELFDLWNDEFEEKDIAAKEPQIVADLKKEYEAWFADVTKKGFAPPRIIVGSEKENPVRLSRQDWRGPNAGWSKDSAGYWEVKVARAGKYTVRIHGADEFAQWEGTIGKAKVKGAYMDGTVFRAIDSVTLEAGDARVEFVIDAFGGGAPQSPTHIELEYTGPVK